MTPPKAFFDELAAESDRLKETPKAAAAFIVYCALDPGERSLALVAAKMGMRPASVRLVKKWSAQNRWQERVKKYDLAAAAEELRQSEQAVRQMNERHALSATSAQVVAWEYISSLMKQKKLSSLAAVQLLKIVYDVERVSRGGETERATVKLTGPDGGPVETTNRVMVYLPQKDALPSITVESDQASTRSLPVPVSESVEDIKRRLEQQVAAYLSPKRNA